MVKVIKKYTLIMSSMYIILGALIGGGLGYIGTINKIIYEKINLPRETTFVALGIIILSLFVSMLVAAIKFNFNPSIREDNDVFEKNIVYIACSIPSIFIASITGILVALSSPSQYLDFWSIFMLVPYIAINAGVLPLVCITLIVMSFCKLHHKYKKS